MADLDKLKAEIAALATRRKSVRFAEVKRIVSQLGKLGYEAGSREVRHGELFWVGDRTFQITSHNKGSSHIKSYAVDVFLDAMIDLGLFDEG
jgi:hypothetical protein